jgi:molybdopterin synthase sulfur carrier subunit
MNVLVRIPTPLQRLTGGEKEVKIEGATVAEVVTDLENKYPGFAERILDEQGELRRFVNIYVDEEDIRFLQGLSTRLKDGSEVSIIPAVAGG